MDGGVVFDEGGIHLQNIFDGMSKSFIPHRLSEGVLHQLIHDGVPEDTAGLEYKQDHTKETRQAKANQTKFSWDKISQKISNSLGTIKTHAYKTHWGLGTPGQVTKVTG